MAREYFCAYHSYLDNMRSLSNEEKGRLFDACLEYSANGILVELTGNERFVWDGIKSQMDRDIDKYEALCEKNKENITKRYDRIRSNTTVYEALPTTTKPTKEKEKDKEKDILEQAIIFFKEHRKKLGKPMTDHAADLLRKKLEELAPNDKKKQADLVDYAITKGWQSVYLPDEKDRKQSFSKPQERGTEPDEDRYAITDGFKAAF